MTIKPSNYLLDTIGSSYVDDSIITESDSQWEYVMVDNISKETVTQGPSPPGTSIVSRNTPGFYMQDQTPHHDERAQTQVIDHVELESIPFSSPDSSVAESQGATLHPSFDMLGLLPGAELCEIPWHPINYPLPDPPPFGYAFGENECDRTQFDFDIPSLEYPLQPGGWSPTSNCSSVSSDDPLGASIYSDVSYRKRPSRDSPCYDSDSETESGPSTNKKAKHTCSNATDPDSTSVVFACPFFKRYPHKHRACANFVLRRVRDVKQHLNRKHHTPKFYCARCYDIFSNAKERDDHTRGGDCEYRECPHFEGITEAQREQLMNTKERKSSLEEQWFAIWDILFPNVGRPRSVSCYSPREEAVACLRDVWSTRSSELLADVGQIDIKPVIDPNDSTIHFLMERIFSLLEAESSLPSQPVRKSSKPQAWGIGALDFKHMSPCGPLPCGELRDESNLQLAVSPSDEFDRK